MDLVKKKRKDRRSESRESTCFLLSIVLYQVATPIYLFVEPSLGSFFHNFVCGATLNMSKLWRRCSGSPVGGVVLVRKISQVVCTKLHVPCYLHIHMCMSTTCHFAKRIGKHCNVSRVSSPGSLFIPKSILLRIYKSQNQCENTSSKLVGNEMHVLLSCFLALTVQSKAYNMEIQLENQTVSMDTTIYPQL